MYCGLRLPKILSEIPSRTSATGLCVTGTPDTLIRLSLAPARSVTILPTLFLLRWDGNGYVLKQAHRFLDMLPRRGAEQYCIDSVESRNVLNGFIRTNP